jgi:ketosteroid isomerase-like protein
MATDYSKEAIEAELARCRAISADDFETLASLLADDMVYVHASGRSEDKTTFIRGFDKSKRTVERTNLDAREYGNVVIMTGVQVVRTAPRDGSREAVELAANVLQAWVKSNTGWQLVAHQGTPPPARTGA